MREASVCTQLKHTAYTGSAGTHQACWFELAPLCRIFSATGMNNKFSVTLWGEIFVDPMGTGSSMHVCDVPSVWLSQREASSQVCDRKAYILGVFDELNLYDSRIFFIRW